LPTFFTFNKDNLYTSDLIMYVSWQHNKKALN